MPKKPKPDDWVKSETWPASKVEMRPLSWIKEYEANPRSHPPAQIDLLAKSMRDEGVTMPILVDEGGVIIAGHGRRRAAMQNRYDEYPVVIARGWSEDQKRAARIKDNSYGLMSGWTTEFLRSEIQLLNAADYDLKLLGFGEAQLVQFTTLPAPPEQFKNIGEVSTTFCCPRCKHRWSGNPLAGAAKEENNKRKAKKNGP
jgi:hypothetical protein